MTPELSPRLQRILAVGLLAATLLLAWGLIVDPLLTFVTSRRDERGAQLRALVRDHAILVKDPQIKEALATVTASPRWARLYDGDKPDKAVLQMESELKELIATPNNPTSITAVPAASKGLLTRIAVKVTLNMPIDQFGAFLSRLQAHSKLLQIDALTVQAPDYQSANTNPALAIQAEIAGYLLTPSWVRH
jgi:type II secretion system (T2SS) protein M